MEIWKSDRWIIASAGKKIIYYPEFFYGVRNENYKVADSYFVENEVLSHLHKMKLLLMYFHYINIPFGHFYAPFDKIHTDVFNSLFANAEFRNMVSEHLVMYTIRPTESPIVYWEWIGEELSVCGFNNALVVNDDLKAIFDDLLMVERSPEFLNRSQGTLSNVRDLVNRSKFLDEDIEKIKQAIDDGMRGGHSFMHEVFVSRLQDEKYDCLHQAMSNNYFRRSEITNYNTLSYRPLNNNNYGSLLRKNTLNDVYAFLYSPDFFIFFISQFINVEKINLYKISIHDILNLRNCDFWDEFVNEYHELLGEINKQLVHVTEESIIDTSQNALKRKFMISGWREFGELLLIEIIKTIMPDALEALGNAIGEYPLADKIKLQSLKVKYKGFYSFLTYISKEFRL